MTKLRIATRGSALALWQANTVKDALCAASPGLEAELVVLKTTGDVTLDRPLDKIGDKGMFTKELERALVDGEADLCVHSMKDVPSELAPGCAIGAMLPRADVRDALVCGPRLTGVASLDALPAGTRIGTGS
ncbi:MAG: hydroxymethylbilane synthase, partial [Coriobacteriaceae bacterium]|nr:hydroxymethylbilane synthase [Coriobacteriaceae bacterium]